MFGEIFGFWLFVIVIGGLVLCTCISDNRKEREKKLEARIKQLEDNTKIEK